MKCNVLVYFCLFANAIAFGQDPVNDSQALEITGETRLVFASQQRGQKLLKQIGPFIQKMQDLERQIRLESTEPVSQEQYLSYLASGVEEWQPADREVIRQAAGRLRKLFEGLKLPFPPEIHLIRVAKNVEANAPHCRGASIVLPDGFFDSGQVDNVLAHELFHVLSSHNKDLRDKMYSIIGFSRCEEIDLPASLLSRRLTNPDAPLHEHFVELERDGVVSKYIPVTFTKSASYGGGNLFANLEFQLMELERSGEALVPRMKDAKPVLVSPREMPSYLQKIGRNTGYIIHPEETLADNFSMMVLSSPNIVDPWVTSKLRMLLSE